MMGRVMTVCLSVLMALAACTGEGPSADRPIPEGGEMMKLASTAFAEGEMIPKLYTCDGEDISPPLSWSSVPDGTKTLALICDDPDAPVGTWVHWVLFNLPPDLEGLPQAIPGDQYLDNKAMHGLNSWRRTGYGGPCPPGGTHRYFFKLYALDAPLAFSSSPTAKEVEKAMKGHVLAQAQLMGRYARSR